ncbi:MAG: TlyA family RNA methyltransferase [Leucobacter sp.]
MTKKKPDSVVTSKHWQGDPERLDRVLAGLELARSRSHATDLIAAGGAYIDGVLASKPGTRVHAGAEVTVHGSDHYVSRGAYKLIAALDAFSVDPTGQLALDLGASTGGFTQVLLERGAREVCALDVGHGQLAQVIRDDPRVRVVEGCNARNLDHARLAALTGTDERPMLVVGDLSFISLTLILPAIARCTGDDADIVLLIKPQFEVGRVRNGVVTDPVKWEEAILHILHAAAESGFATLGLAPSPVVGTEGNREFLVHFHRDEAPDPREWNGRVHEMCAAAASNDEGSRA